MSELYELLTFEAFGQRYPELTSRHQILPGRGVFCKAERLQSGVIGTYAMPQRMAPTGEKHFFGYYLTEKKLLLVEKGGFLQGLLPGLPGETPAQLLSELLARLTAEDMESLQHYEERLTALEEVLLAQQAEDFDKKIFRIRRELSVLAGYYAQLDDLYAVLADAIPDAEEHVQRLLEEICRELEAGNIAADPFWRGPEKNACRWCDYATACHFEEGRGEDRRRWLPGMDAGTFWARLEEEEKKEE